MSAPAYKFDVSAIRVALERNLWELWSRFGRGDGCILHEEPHALWFDTVIPTLPYNAVLRFAAEDDIDRRIDELFHHYEQRGVPFLWLVHPTAQPADLEDRLRKRGFCEVESCPGMFMDLGCLPEPGSPPDGVLVREVTENSDVADLLELVAWRWSVPPQMVSLLPGITRAFDVANPGSAVRAWIARRDGVPVAKIVLNLAAGAAGVYGVATKPEARGLGLARFLTLEAFHTSRRLGYKLGVLHSTPMARTLYEKIGFRADAPFRIFAPPQALHL